MAFLKAKGVSRLDYVVAIHPDADHIGGLISVLNNFTVGKFLDSGCANQLPELHSDAEVLPARR